MADGPNFAGSGTDTLVVSDITSTDGTVGSYKAVASNPYGSATSAVAVITVTNPPAVSVAFLRKLVDNNYIATNSGALWQVTGTVTTFTNLTTANTSSYYLQDSSGCGINIFATFGSSFRPAQGDVVTFTGFLSSFNSTLELLADKVNNAATGYEVLSNNIAGLPAPKVIPFSITNNLAFCETNLEGSIVMLTNVYMPATNISGSANTTVNVTNAAGEIFSLFFSSQDLDVTNRTLPTFAWSVVGAFTQNINNTNAVRNAGYSVTVTRFSDIVTDAPPAVVASVTHSGNNSVISWQDVPHDPLNYSYGSNYSYSVLSSTAVTGPYTPLKQGLTFTTPAASYTDTSASAAQKFYKVVSP